MADKFMVTLHPLANLDRKILDELAFLTKSHSAPTYAELGLISDLGMVAYWDSRASIICTVVQAVRVSCTLPANSNMQV